MASPMLLLLAMMGIVLHVMTASGLTCYSCRSSVTRACADPFNSTGDDIGRCNAQSHCVAVRLSGGSLVQCEYIKCESKKSRPSEVMTFFHFLADRTNGRTIATLLRLSSVVCRRL